MNKYFQINNKTLFIAGCCLACVLFAGCSKEKKESAETQSSSETSVELPPSFQQMMPDVMQAPADPNALVVEVNGKKLLQGLLDERIQKFMASRFQGNVNPEQMQMMQQNVREQLIQAFVAETLLIGEIENLKISVEKTAIDELYNDVIERMKQAAPEGTTDVLAANGFTEQDLRKNIENELRIRKLLEEKTAATSKVTPEEITAFYTDKPEYFESPESANARHILFMTNKSTPEEKAQKKVLAEKCRADLIGGASFEELAKQHSDCPSKEKGGDLGSFTRGRMVKEFEDAAFSQKIDEIGPIVETEYGYHIIQVTKRTEGGKKALDEVKADIETFLKRQKQEDGVKQYINDLKTKADIKFGETPAAAPVAPAVQ